jgi:Homeodomain-like domain
MSPQVTNEGIAELLAVGITCKEIAGKLNCSESTIYLRMRKARRSNPEIARQDMEQRTCECGQPKRPSSEKCAYCTFGKSRPKSRPWVSGEAVQQDLRLVEEKPEATEQPEATAQPDQEENVKCQCGRLDREGKPRIKSVTAQACIACEGTSEELDRLMAANRGISVQELRRKYRFQKYGQKRQGVAA